MVKNKRKKKKRRYQRGSYSSLKSCQIFKFRSGWEHKVMLYLDSNTEVEVWSYEKIVIPYISNIRSKKQRKYYPDFFIQFFDGRKEVWEIKPKRKINQLTIKKKSLAAEKWCQENGMTYKIITEIELKDMGLL